jgi:HD-like signal output (HDOD) protein
MTQVIAEETAQQLLKGITIPPQPQIMVDLHMEMAMADACMDAIADIISKDVGISGCILKVVNSPFFKRRNQITSIKQALSLLGIENVANIVNSLSIRDSFSDAAIIEMTRFWDNAMDVAMTCAAISRTIGIATPDEAYTLGLFHNVGIPLLVNKFGHHYTQVLEAAYGQSKYRITDIENAKIDTNHAVVGYFVARAWKLPIYLSEAVADHHKTEEIFAEKISCNKSKMNLLSILKLAENTCKTYKTLGGAAIDFEFQRIKNDVLLYVGLSDYEFEDLQAELIDLSLTHNR